MIFPRKIYPFLKAHLGTKPITVLTGMRRTGKTTLIQQLLSDAPSKNTLYLDLERVDHRELFAEKNYDAILRAFQARGLSLKERMYVAREELQLVPQGPSVLKYLYDHHNIKFIVTGSSSYYLKNLFSESLSGRKKIFELFPLDFGEFLTFRNIPWKQEAFFEKTFDPHEYERLKAHYEDFIRYGGFPEVVLTDAVESRRDLLADIISSYVNIDIQTISDFRNADQVYAVSKMLASRVGTKLDYAKLSRLSGVSRPTLMAYIAFLEKTYCIARVPVVAKHPDREIVKAKKLYFYDTGVANVFADLSGGAQFENTVFNQLRHHGAISYYSLKNGSEIDFIVDQRYALEAKESPASQDLHNLARLAAQAEIPRYRLVGRHAVPGMADYIWGGDIR